MNLRTLYRIIAPALLVTLMACTYEGQNNTSALAKDDGTFNASRQSVQTQTAIVGVVEVFDDKLILMSGDGDYDIIGVDLKKFIGKRIVALGHLVEGRDSQIFRVVKVENIE